MGVGEIVAKAKELPAEDALVVLGAAIERASAGGMGDSDVATLLVHHAGTAERLRKWELAERGYRDATERFARAHGADDPRARHAASCIGRVLRAKGDVHGALAFYEQAMTRGGGASTFVALIVEELRRALHDESGADRALDATLEAARASLVDPMVMSGAIVLSAQRLAERGRHADAARLLEDALIGLGEIEAGKRVSPSARVPSQVKAEIEAALASVRPR